MRRSRPKFPLSGHFITTPIPVSASPTPSADPFVPVPGRFPHLHSMVFSRSQPTSQEFNGLESIFHGATPAKRSCKLLPSHPSKMNIHHSLMNIHHLRCGSRVLQAPPHPRDEGENARHFIPPSLTSVTLRHDQFHRRQTSIPTRIYLPTRLLMHATKLRMLAFYPSKINTPATLNAAVSNASGSPPSHDQPPHALKYLPCVETILHGAFSV
ncbi:hypothetical protein M413DRAFT_23234 [Hebeloma cylindrosporum]|uniref:Uncharacterized protein n=1 Tax=Hebeloma cylindrosporum TaxID=76867 RepID=A0A0C3CDP6_HEBCY|nr:hypothetical protein M413DRAFT_23234 [Hebeloma cylindrosporum h7]